MSPVPPSSGFGTVATLVATLDGPGGMTHSAVLPALDKSGPVSTIVDTQMLSDASTCSTHVGIEMAVILCTLKIADDGGGSLRMRGLQTVALGTAKHV